MAPVVWRTRVVWLDGPAAFSFACWAILAWLSRSGSASVAVVLPVVAVTWVALLVAWRKADAVPAAQLLGRLWIWAVLFRLAGLAGLPLLEDDYFRYLWDGFRFAATGNPYEPAPAAFFGDPAIPARFQAILDGINHPHLTTVYGPACQWAFRLAYWMAPAELLPWKLLVVAADLAAVGLLLRLTKPANALLYAWCPLSIQETAFTGHPEALGGLAAVASLYFVRKRWMGAAGAAVVAAAGVKVFGALLAPFVLWRGGPRAWGCAAAAVGLLWGPFWIRGNGAEWESLWRMTEEWEFNSSLYAIAAEVAGRTGGKLFCAAAMAAGYLWIWRRSVQAELPRGEWVYALFFLLSPVVNAWYLLWLLPFAAMRPNRWTLAPLAMVSLSYVCGIHTGAMGLGAYEHPAWLRVVEYGGIAAVGLWPWGGSGRVTGRMRMLLRQRLAAAALLLAGGGVAPLWAVRSRTLRANVETADMFPRSGVE